MFSLSTNVKNIIVDVNLFNQDALVKQGLVPLLKKLEDQYSIYSLGPLDEYLHIRLGTGIGTDLLDLDAFSDHMKRYGLHSHDTIVLTHSADVLELTIIHDVSTILIREHQDDHPLHINCSRFLPDLVLTIAEVNDLLLKEKSFGIVNELAAQNITGTGSIHPLGKVTHYNDDFLSINLMFAGRYFVQEDPKSYFHSLSNLLLRLKNSQPYAVDTLAVSLKASIDFTLDYYKDIEIITVVPAKPGKVNHLDALMTHDALRPYTNIIDTELLHTTKDYPTQKQAGSLPDRSWNVHQAFATKKGITGHVLLIDDIYTSGSTVFECAKVLYAHGATMVTVLPLAKTQHNSFADLPESIQDKFAAPYRLNFRTQDGEPFWAASNGEFLDYEAGKKRYMQPISENEHDDVLPF